MSAFKHVEGEYAIIASSGVFKQVAVYIRDHMYYAAACGGFVQLRVDGTTSNAKVRLDELSIGSAHLRGTKMGRLCSSVAPEWNTLKPSQLQHLAGLPLVCTPLIGKLDAKGNTRFGTDTEGKQAR